MKFKTHATISGCPEFKVKMRSGPMDFRVDGEAGLKVSTAPIRANVSEIPLTLRIPFLRRNDGIVAVASVSPFGVTIEPIEAEVKAFGVHLHGTLGNEKEGMCCSMEGEVDCRMEMDLAGKIPSPLRATLMLADEMDMDDCGD